MNIGREEAQRIMSDSQGEKIRYWNEIEKEIDDLAKHLTDLGVATSKIFFRTALRILSNYENIMQEQLNQLSVLDGVYEGENEDIIDTIRKLEESLKVIKDIKEKFERVLEDLDRGVDDSEMYKEMYETYKSWINLGVFGFPVGENAEEIVSKLKSIAEAERIIRKESKKIGLNY